MMVLWAKSQALKNSEIQANNDTIKKQCDKIIAKGNEAANTNNVTKLMRQDMGDITAKSR